MSEVRIVLEENQLQKLKKTIYVSLLEEIQRARQDAGLEKRYLNKKEICEYLNCANNTLDKWITMGLPRISVGGSVRYDKYAIDKWLNNVVEKA